LVEKHDKKRFQNTPSKDSSNNIEQSIPNSQVNGDTEFDPILIDSIARTVSEIEGKPKDHLEVAVILEILGYSDKDAQDIGFSNLFNLSKVVHKSVPKFAVEDIKLKRPDWRPSSLLLFFAGMFYNLGWMIMLISLFLGGQSLWAAKDLPVDISTAIGMGVLFGLVSTGGLQQFTAWKLIYYQMQGNQPLAKFIMKRNLVIGTLILLLIIGLFALLNTFFLNFPLQVLMITIYFFSLIGIYRLFATPVFAFKKFGALLFISFSALAVMFASYYIFIYFGFSRPPAVILSQSVGLGVLIFTSAYFSYIYIFSKKEERSADEPPFYSRPEVPKNVKTPRYWVLAYEGLPLIFYGTLYFVFLFGDRLISWLGSGPFMINYNRTYQIGVDLALLLLIPITGVKFTYLYRMSDHLEKNLRRLKISDTSKFNKILKDFYLKMVVGVTIFGGLFVLVAYLFSETLVGFAGGSAESARVFRWALLGIFFFGLFLTNSVFSFCFRKNKAIVIILAIGCVFSYSLSYSFSNIEQWYTVFGFLISTLFLLISSFILVWHMLKKSDYVYYQSF
jgi:hypothetical protein